MFSRLIIYYEQDTPSTGKRRHSGIVRNFLLHGLGYNNKTGYTHGEATCLRKSGDVHIQPLTWRESDYLDDGKLGFYFSSI